MHTTKRRAVGVLLALFAILGMTFVSTGSASASDLKFQVVHNAGTSASPATIEDGCYTKDWSDGYHLGFCVWLSYNNDYSSDVSADISDTAWAEKVHVYCQRNGVYVGCRGITFDSHIRHGYNSDGTNRYYEGYNYSCGVFSQDGSNYAIHDTTCNQTGWEGISLETIGNWHLLSEALHPAVSLCQDPFYASIYSIAFQLDQYHTWEPGASGTSPARNVCDTTG
jgi:hypothetical protein